MEKERKSLRVCITTQLLAVPALPQCPNLATSDHTLSTYVNIRQSVNYMRTKHHIEYRLSCVSLCERTVSIIKNVRCK